MFSSFDLIVERIFNKKMTSFKITLLFLLKIRMVKDSTNKKPREGNYVYQDLKKRGGCKSTRGAEKVKRAAKIKRNDRMRAAYGGRKRRPSVAEAMRIKFAEEMRRDKTIVEVQETDDSAMPVFSDSVDRERIAALMKGELPLPNSLDTKEALPGLSDHELLLMLKREFGNSFSYKQTRMLRNPKDV